MTSIAFVSFDQSDGEVDWQGLVAGVSWGVVSTWGNLSDLLFTICPNSLRRLSSVSFAHTQVSIEYKPTDDVFLLRAYEGKYKGKYEASKATMALGSIKHYISAHSGNTFMYLACILGCYRVPLTYCTMSKRPAAGRGPRVRQGLYLVTT